MTNQTDSPRDPAWYQERWNELLELLPASDPEEAVSQVKALRDRTQALEEQTERLKEAGFDLPEHALRAIKSMEEQLNELYGEKQATEGAETDLARGMEGDTFDQLQALMAREEKLQRELGVSSPSAVIEMVQGLIDQLEDLYHDRDTGTSDDTIFDTGARPDTDSRDDSRSLQATLEDELGLSDPQAIVTMVRNLEEQLSELYRSRKRLAELNLSGAEDAVKMVNSLKQQLEEFYDRKERMSAHGIQGVDHALAMIENMEKQLCELYEETSPPESEAASSMDHSALEAQLDELKEEKNELRQTRDRLQAQLDQLKEEVGLDDPEAISTLIDSMGDQLNAVYERRERQAESQTSPSDTPLLEDQTLNRLETMSDDDLDALSVGLWGLDDEGIVRRANEHALQWPDVTAHDPKELEDTHFFDEIALAANNSLFRGRFEEGVQEGTMDEKFVYTYVSEEAPPQNLLVQLHRASKHTTNWIAFRLL